ncbi:BAD_collapsed_G0042820.mRNA.1.CDS.1 [Saccharomyces cerevisiae]|nr:BAD_collapsed_G0042820.mRNA.1.CDS.1 [Saccharomyces cerevisiae]
MSFTEDQEKIALEILSKDKHEFYEILKVDRKATDSEIKKAYRKLAIKLHPDKNSHPKAGEAFKVINRAFEVLSNEEKRSIYDRIGRDPDDRQMPSRGAASGFRGSAGGSPMGGGFEDMFFNSRFGGQRAGPPEDIFDFLFNAGVQPIRRFTIWAFCFHFFIWRPRWFQSLY